MEETEKTEQPSSCLSKKSRVFPLFVSLVILSGAGFTTHVYYSRGENTPLSLFSEDVMPKVGELEKRIAVLEEKINTAKEPAQVFVPTDTSEIKALKDLIDSKTLQDQERTRKLVAAAFAFLDLRELARSGKPFAAQLSYLKAAASDNPRLADLATTLEPASIEGVPTVETLRSLLREEEKNIAAMPFEPEETPTWKTRAISALRTLISIRPSNDERLSALISALEAGDAARAQDATKSLPDDVQKALSSWQSKLDARVTLDATLGAIVAHFSTAPAQGNAP